MKYIPITILLIMTFSATAKTFVSTAVIDTVLSKENVDYNVTQDESNIYLNISTADKKTMMSMVRLGVTVFFDIKGKKKENVYVKYPSEAMALNTNKRRREEGRPMDIENEEERGDRIMEILEKDYPQKAEYVYFDDSEEFNIQLNSLTIEVAFNYDQDTESLVYSLTIPKTRINTNDKKDLSKLTIGVKTVKEERKDGNANGLSGNIGGMTIGGQQRGQGRGAGIGGGQGGRGHGGGRGGQGGGRPNSERPTRPEEVLLDFWFDANSGT